MESNALDPISSFAPVQAVVGESVSEISVIDEEEERRIVAEVWETFKDENFEALSQAFQGMTDKEIEGIEQDILLQRYTPEYDPTYDMVVDMEMQVMDQTIDRYMRLEKAYETIPQQGSDMAATISLAITLLSRGPCVRCRSGPLAFEPTVSQSQSEGIRSSCALCGFVLEKEALLHIANTAKSHSDNCAGQVQVAFDEEMGLLLFCTQCGLLA
ncbi:hypothetical protein BGZ54_006514 [Gamsiella multidivaricata]|nr:hypothetical protein BGZ54_006514 [Gamsiella multidivaricata]